MANPPSSSFLLFFFLSLLFLCSSSGTLVGFSFPATGNNIPHRSFFTALPDSSLSLHLYLNRTFINPNASQQHISRLEAHVTALLPLLNLNTLVFSIPHEHAHLPHLLSSLKSFHSLVTKFHFPTPIRVSVAFSLPYLQNLNMTYQTHLRGILDFIIKTRSLIVLQDRMKEELSVGDRFIQSAIDRATFAASLLPCSEVAVILLINTSASLSATQVAEFTHKVSASLENNKEVKAQIAELYVQVSSMEDSVQREEEEKFPSSRTRRKVLSSFKTSLRDTIDPPTTPIPTTPVTLPTNNPTPTIVTVPSTNPVTVAPMDPDSTIPSTTPVTIPSTNPLVPITNPVTTPSPVTVPGAQPITNPVTTYPAPTGNVPATTTSPLAPPVTTNAPAIPGQSWCVAKIGSSETALQSALDYACGFGGADCSQIQQGGNCYNPNTVQNHASFAFNSYYQKNPVASSCDFGGAANIISTNPSTGSCIYASFSSSSTTNTVSPTTPIITTPPTSSIGAGMPSGSSSTPSTVLNSSNPASGTAAIYGSDSPPTVSTSNSCPLKVFIASLLACLVSGIIIMVRGM